MKKLVTSYVFDASAKTITSSDFLNLDAILLITNVTDNVIIYNFSDHTRGGTLTGETLTLLYNTTSMDDADSLQIFVDDLKLEVSYDLVEALYALIDKLSFLAGVKGIASDLRVTPLSTPNMSTLATLTNQAQMGGYNAAMMVQNSQNITAVLSNIDNIS